jgi:hypothetical protein
MRPVIIALSGIAGGLIALLGGGWIAFQFRSHMHTATQDAMGVALLIMFVLTPACAVLSGLLAAYLTRKR